MGRQYAFTGCDRSGYLGPSRDQRLRLGYAILTMAAIRLQAAAKSGATTTSVRDGVANGDLSMSMWMHLATWTPCAYDVVTHGCQ